jgi:hypothetical protein
MAFDGRCLVKVSLLFWQLCDWRHISQSSYVPLVASRTRCLLQLAEVEGVSLGYDVHLLVQGWSCEWVASDMTAWCWLLPLPDQLLKFICRYITFWIVKRSQVIGIRHVKLVDAHLSHVVSILFLWGQIHQFAIASEPYLLRALFKCLLEVVGVVVEEYFGLFFCWTWLLQ